MQLEKNKTPASIHAARGSKVKNIKAIYLLQPITSRLTFDFTSRGSFSLHTTPMAIAA
jgi:hypothetical protein